MKGSNHHRIRLLRAPRAHQAADGEVRNFLDGLLGIHANDPSGIQSLEQWS